MVTVLAYNIHYGKKLELIQDWLLGKKDLDIICLQEFPFEKNSKFLKLFEKNGYKYAFAPAYVRKKTQYGELTLYNKKNIKLESSKVINLGTIIFENRHIEKLFRKNKGQRSSLLTHFKYKGKDLILANTHLFCFALNSHRINQLTKILENIQKVGNNSTFSSVILGDFNYTSIIRQTRLINFMKKNELKNAYKSSTHKLFFLKQQLDYVFYNGCDVEKVLIDRIKYSDHYPVQFKIDFN